MSKLTLALTELISDQISQRRSRAPTISFTNPRGRRDTAEEESAGAIIGSTTEIDASSCLESTEVTYVPPTPEPAP